MQFKACHLISSHLISCFRQIEVCRHEQNVSALLLSIFLPSISVHHRETCVEKKVNMYMYISLSSFFRYIKAFLYEVAAEFDEELRRQKLTLYRLTHAFKSYEESKRISNNEEFVKYMSVDDCVETFSSLPYMYLFKAPEHLCLNRSLSIAFINFIYITIWSW
jgi:hypothetical protein